MKIEEYRKGEASAVVHCMARDNCPFAPLCAPCADDPDDDPSPTLFPTCVDVSPGDLVWVDLRREQRVYAIQSGQFSCMSNLEHDNEVPFAIYGSGNVIGVSELYIAREVASAYYLKALSSGRVCSFPAKALRRVLEEAPSPFSERLLSCALTNISSASFTLHKIALRTPLSDRIAMLLLSLRDLALREGFELQSAALTHEDLAALVGADRASITRALHKLEKEGCVELGYRSLALKPSLLDRPDLVCDAQTEFHRPW